VTHDQVEKLVKAASTFAGAARDGLVSPHAGGLANVLFTAGSRIAAGLESVGAGLREVAAVIRESEEGGDRREEWRP
jgi:hypothetical protein